jgi:hypothetical protein
LLQSKGRKRRKGRKGPKGYEFKILDLKRSYGLDLWGTVSRRRKGN